MPVLVNELLETVDPKPGENLIDGTIGGGGHAEKILEKTSPEGKLLGMDLDEEAIRASKQRLEKYSDRIFLAKGNFVDFVDFKEKYDFHPINIFFLDLGISSQQLGNEMLGISFLKNNPLNMRIGENDYFGDDRTTAENIVNNWNQDKIESILKEYGEERYAKSISENITKARKTKKIANTKQLVDIISDAVPSGYKNRRIHFATKTFQALRIAVNHELENLEKTLPLALENMAAGGRIAVISFHSLEDRIVKHFFQKEAKDCICEAQVPKCVCGHKKRLEIVTKKPIGPSENEVFGNIRSRSAKLRVAKKISD